MPFPALNPALERALLTQGYAEPTPVQAAVLAADATDRDLLVSAQTGSGKTVAFGLAIATTLLGDRPRMGQAGPPVALMIAPTRELAMQVARELTWLYAQTGAIVVTCVGGMDAQRERRALNAGCHIVVGTPGRLRDHLDRGNLDLSALDVVVLDEADEMLDLGFKEELEAILDATPEERRTLLFSATIAKEIAGLARQYQKAAVRIDTASSSEPHGDIEYRAIRIAPNEIEHAVVNVLRLFEAPGALVFCSTRETVRHLFAALRERGFAAVALSGELTQKERTDALQALRDGHARVCVATDVAARGLDLPDLGLVIHADLPVNRAGLLHRSGRTGRAGRKGVSVLLVPYQRRRRVEQMLASANIEAVWSGPPSAEEIRAGDQARLLDDPMLNEPPAEEDLALARLVLANRTPEQVATALIRFHRSRLPEPEELYDAPRDAPAPYNPRDRSRSNADRPDRGPDRERGPNPHEGIIGETVWFRLAVGRSENADPKWLIPLICRNGHVTKKDIGQIRIFDRETKFEIAVGVADRFTAAIANGPPDRVKIEPAGAPGKPTGKPGGAHVKPRDGKPYAGKPHAGKSNDAKAHDGKPREGGPPPKYAGKPNRSKPPFKRD
jgi:ATP-dependent RNA helicase DeaD